MDTAIATDEKLLNECECAEMLNLSAATLRRWRAGFDAPVRPLPFVKLGRTVRYRPSDIREWVEAGVTT